MNMQITITQYGGRYLAELKRETEYAEEHLAVGKGDTAAEALSALATRMMVGAVRIASEIGGSA